MIVGIGIDVASIERMALNLDRFGDRIWRRVLTLTEQEQLALRRDRSTALAGRFAAKEAASKALGAPRDVWWHHVEIVSGELGAPSLRWRGPALAHIQALGVTASWLSITHDAGVAAAVVVLER